MNKEEASMIGFQLVAYAGNAKSNLMEALDEAEKQNFERVDELIKEADENIKEAHNTQTQLLAKEASGDNIDLGLILVHGQDHLMTTILLRDMMQHLVNLYKKNQSN